TQAADPEANIIFGAGIDESLTDEVRITVIATGFEKPVIAPKKASPFSRAFDDEIKNDFEEIKDDDGVSLPPLYEQRPEAPKPRPAQPRPAQRPAGAPARPQPRPARPQASTRIPERKSEPAPRPSAFAEPRPRRGFSPDTPSFLRRPAKKDEE
ncbi:MAG: hypothetical protein IJA93_02280, partial [Clostridia bacterium]|nr:hypothetical protein [Clostridia bacterium]